jgi:hypothetical protein
MTARGRECVVEGSFIIAAVLSILSACITTTSRRDLLAVREEITPGMSRETMKTLLRERDVVLSSETAEWLNVQEQGLGWILVVVFEENRAVAVCVRDYDSLVRRPLGAPPDLIWKAEAARMNPFCHKPSARKD